MQEHSDELKALEDFHGHLGPFVVVGLKIGKLANELIGKGKGLKALVETGLNPPLSCIIDGIQFTTACTLGKNNIKVIDENKAIAVFKRGNLRLKVKLKDEIREKITAEMKNNEVEVAIFVYNSRNEELFDYELVRVFELKDLDFDKNLIFEKK